MIHTVYLQPKRLTDGSIVYDVQIGDVTLPCITENDAGTLITKLRAAIEDHTNETTQLRLLLTVNA